MLSLRVFGWRGVAGCGFGPGHEHTSEDHGVELVDVVFSCASGAGRGLFLASLALAVARQTVRKL